MLLESSKMKYRVARSVGYQSIEERKEKEGGSLTGYRSGIIR